MHRPKKNKIHNPTIPDELQDAASGVDERNLIDAADSEEISFEDRVRVYWDENRGFINACIFVLAALVIGYNGFRIYASYSLEKLQTAYSEARATGHGLAEFAQANSSTELGGVAALSVADEAFLAADYEEAVNFYTIASSSLKGSLLEGRALIGQAFARYYNGQENDARAQLADIAANARLADAARAEAAYHLAIAADIRGNTEEFVRFAEQIRNLPLAGQWQQRLSMHEQQNL